MSTCLSIAEKTETSASLHHLIDPLLDLLAGLTRLLLNTIDDVVGVVACLVHVLLRHFAEFSNELLFQLRRTVADLLLEHVVNAHPSTSVVSDRLRGYPNSQALIPSVAATITRPAYWVFEPQAEGSLWTDGGRPGRWRLFEPLGS